MSIGIALLLGIVEGITEFLPVSSTAHLLLTQKLLGMPFSANLASFDIAIQMGAILAVLLTAGKRLLIERRMIGLTLAAFVPTAILGALLHGSVTSILFQSTGTMLTALAIGGVIMILVEQRRRTSPTAALTYTMAIVIGIIQSIAMVPGVSRSGATIIGSMLLGLSRRDAVEFSFLVAIPTMLAATSLDLMKNPTVLTDSPLTLSVGFLAAFVTAFLSIKWLRRFIESHTFTGFGIYRIIIALGLFWIMLA
jgi:undecaprenyl-diphosphatase